MVWGESRIETRDVSDQEGRGQTRPGHPLQDQAGLREESEGLLHRETLLWGKFYNLHSRLPVLF